MKKIKCISIIAKEYWDRANGNSYFSARIDVFRKREKETFSLPFQYGYGDQYIHESRKLLAEKKIIPSDIAIWAHCRENDIPLITVKIERCTQRDVKDWGS